MGKSFWIFFSITLALVSLSIFDFQFESHQNEKKSAQSKLFNGDLKSKARKIRLIKGPGFPEINLEWREGKWWVTSPVLELADQSAVDTWLGDLNNQSFEREFLARQESPLDFSFYGLQETDKLSSIEIETVDAQTLGLRLGLIKNFENKVYLKPYPQSDRVWMAGSQIEGYFLKSSFDFRERRLFAQAPDFKRVEFRSSNRSLELILNADQQWQMAGANYKLDQNKVRDFLYLLTGQSILAFVDESVPKNPGYQAVSLVVWDQKEQRHEYFMEKVKEDYLVWIASIKKTVRISQVDFTKFKDLQFSALRDRREPFSLTPASVDSIKISQGSQVRQVKKQGDQWVALPVNQDLATSSPIDWASTLLDQLSVLTVEEFSEDLKDIKLSTLPNLTLILEGSGASSPFQFEFYTPQDIKIGPMNKKLVGVKSSLFESLVFISEADFNKLELGAKLSPK